ncbi:MAG: ADP-ribosylglycohydrolase family protein [Synechococcaceae cyanobacterium SM1_2_3]|nr:ADP-ribosylglycohydrolase family protein [Synechococcaceae cyanobacterium SM1_2_3]
MDCSATHYVKHETATPASRLRGLLIGTAVGDALGLPAEGLSRQRIQRWFKGDWRHRLIFGRGLISDDTEHTIFVAQGLLRYPTSPELFARRLGWQLRGWLLSLPAGIGFATLRAILKLSLGFSPSRSGVYSAGNGPAMRVAIIGAVFAHDPPRRAAYVAASTRITHTDPKALTGATAIAELSAWIMRESLTQRPPLEPFLAVLRGCGADDRDWQMRVDAIEQAARTDQSVAELAESLGLARGVSGYIYHTVPVVAYAWFRHCGDFRQTLTTVLDCGGDTDTTGAIVGALAGATVGEAGIPAQWRAGITDWPRSLRLLRTLADRLETVITTGQAGAPVRYFWPAIPLRNLIFLLIVLAHGFRRLLPPY